MRQLIKRISGLFRIPFTQWYLRKKRTFRYHGIEIQVPPGVFHPGLFPSTQLLLNFIEHTDISGKKLLDLGTGSGILAIAAARRGADVTATDISKKALTASQQNAAANQINLTLISADVWDGLPEIQFDFILINPPYYRKDPIDETERAWYCGQNMEYFRVLFTGLRGHLSPYGRVMMTFTEDAGLDDLIEIASAYELGLKVHQTRKHWPNGDDYLLEVRVTSER